jgi:hypothetical protein
MVPAFASHPPILFRPLTPKFLFSLVMIGDWCSAICWNHLHTLLPFSDVIFSWSLTPVLRLPHNHNLFYHQQHVAMIYIIHIFIKKNACLFFFFCEIILSVRLSIAPHIPFFETLVPKPCSTLLNTRLNMRWPFLHVEPAECTHLPPWLLTMFHNYLIHINWILDWLLSQWRRTLPPPLVSTPIVPSWEEE